MPEELISVGLDIGTTSTQLVVSKLQVQNVSGSFSVPKMQITRRDILYKSPVHFTPLLDESLVDAKKLKEIVEQEYRLAGITRQEVDTGAVIITGETSRKENAKAVLSALSEFAGQFVVSTAGPDLESVLAAKGAGATKYSEKTGKTLLHMDIGGGTSNLSLIRKGEIVATGCLNVGGRLVKTEQGVLTYVSPVLKPLFDLQVGQSISESQLQEVANMLTQALEMAAGLRPPTVLLQQLTTEGTYMEIPDEPVMISFSGGVADCIQTVHDTGAFGDMGPILGQCIGKSRLCDAPYRLGEETIRATVIGAGCHSTQLSGSTVFYRNTLFPQKDIPVAVAKREIWELPTEALKAWWEQKKKQWDKECLLFLEGPLPHSYEEIRLLGESLAKAGATMVAMEQDIAKALGQNIALHLAKDAPCLCMDGLHLGEENFLDVGAPVGPALPVVVKMLIFGKETHDK